MKNQNITNILNLKIKASTCQQQKCTWLHNALHKSLQNVVYKIYYEVIMNNCSTQRTTSIGTEKVNRLGKIESFRVKYAYLSIYVAYPKPHDQTLGHIIIRETLTEYMLSVHVRLQNRPLYHRK